MQLPWVERFSPLVIDVIVENADVFKLSSHYGESVPNVRLRHLLQKGVVTLPKSTHQGRILQNVDVDFEISEDDMAYLDGLTGTVSVHYGPKRKYVAKP